MHVQNREQNLTGGWGRIGAPLRGRAAGIGREAESRHLVGRALRTLRAARLEGLAALLGLLERLGFCLRLRQLKLLVRLGRLLGRLRNQLAALRKGRRGRRVGENRRGDGRKRSGGEGGRQQVAARADVGRRRRERQRGEGGERGYGPAPRARASLPTVVASELVRGRPARRRALPARSCAEMVDSLAREVSTTGWGLGSCMAPPTDTRCLSASGNCARHTTSFLAPSPPLGPDPGAAPPAALDVGPFVRGASRTRAPRYARDARAGRARYVGRADQPRAAARALQQ